MYSVAMLQVSSQVMYLASAIFSIYIGVVPLFVHSAGPPSFFTMLFWVGGVLLLFAAMVPSPYTNQIALMGSGLTTALLIYGVTNFIGLKLGLVRASSYQPSVFDQVNRVLNILGLALLLVSVSASFYFSLFLSLRYRKACPSQPSANS